MALTSKQDAFKRVALAHPDWPAGRMYREAGYKAATDQVAYTEGSKLLRKPEIQEAMQQARQKADNAAMMTMEERRAFCAKVVRCNINSVREDAPEVLQSLKYDKDGQPEWRVPDKLKAVELDAKLAGELNPKQEIEIVGLQEIWETLTQQSYGLGTPVKVDAQRIAQG